MTIEDGGSYQFRPGYARGSSTRPDTAYRNKIRGIIIRAHKKTGNLTRAKGVPARTPSWKRKRRDG